METNVVGTHSLLKASRKIWLDEWAPEETFPSGIGKTVKWYLTNKGWWRPLLNKKYSEWIAQQYGG